ncbi:hydroxymethylbilane synthase [Bacteriovoracaceae bacterium]|nr:hydroxymethylbilane synthase [Bacteriovoracaceae bacterium]
MLDKDKKSTFTLGTRGSMLALSQAHALLAELKSLEPSFSYDTKIISTQGDQITDKPLWQLEGKDFFTKELDESLLTNKVDMVIHSLKDLSSTRPPNIDLIAISKRTFPNDILFIKNDVVEKIIQGSKKNLVVGTSSPRRVFQINQHLNKYIPQGNNINIETKSLRGNVNTRINKLLTDQFDAICLAFAGVERLAQNSEHESIIHLLRDHCNFILLPIHSFTPSPGQGALAVETCKNNPRYQEIKKLFSKINSPSDRTATLKEKEVFAKFGGNCHLALGVFTQLTPLSDQNVRINGIIEEKIIDQKINSKIIHTGHPLTNDKSKVFIGLPHTKTNEVTEIIYDRLITKQRIEVQFANLKTDILLFTSQHTVPDNPFDSNFINFSAGEKTSKRLIVKNIWVHGTLNEMPYQEFTNFCSSSFLKIYLGKKKPNFKILSHSESGHSPDDLISTYQHQINEKTVDDNSFEESLKKVESFYWTSFSQFLKYKNTYSFITEKKHFCGIGRTYQRFKEHNISNVTPIFGVSHFKQLNNL